MKALFKVKDLVNTLYGPLQLVLYTDNKALASSLQNEKEIHPFASNSIDFLRQTLKEWGMTSGWVSSVENLADVLTKPSKL